MSVFLPQYYGDCDCKQLVAGRMCDACAPAAFGFSSSGCQRCDCHYQGSQNEFCQPETGQVHSAHMNCALLYCNCVLVSV